MNNVEILGGISESIYTSYDKSLMIRGWFLSKLDIGNIELYIDEKMISKTNLGITRVDVFNSYPDYNNKNSGFLINIKCEINDKSNLKLLVKSKNNAILKEVQVKPKFDNLIESFINALSKKTQLEYDTKVPCDTDILLDRLSRLDICLEKHKIDYKDYYKWFNSVNYYENFPKYVGEFKTYLERKSLEHYLSIKHLAKDVENEIWLDVASSNSPFADILKKTGVKKVYKQDLNYPEGLNGEIIGSNANEIPLENASVDNITVHCAIEHFENNADYQFIKEAARILKKGGKLCIIPLYIAEKTVLITSPSVYYGKYKNAKDIPIFSDDVELVIINENARQRQSKFFSLDNLYKKIILDNQDLLNFKLVYHENEQHFNKAPIFSLIGERV